MLQCKHHKRQFVQQCDNNDSKNSNSRRCRNKEEKIKENNLIRERQFKMITSIDITVIIVTVPDICT